MPDVQNSPVSPGTPSNHGDSARVAFIKEICLPFLQKSQNHDGGWGFQPAQESRVEPTAWALLALGEFPSPSEAVQHALKQGRKLLAEVQLQNGGWPAASGDQEGCWVTSLASWAVGFDKEYASNVSRGLRWLSEDRPGDSGFWWRTARKLSGSSRVNAQSASLSGWSWTPHTASWVEPTSFAMIVEQRESPDLLSGVDHRYKIAEAMLYDRMCPGGGWNCGNPKVYGVAGQPQVGPTVWALTALRANSERTENQQSLDWLANSQAAIKSPESLALAHIGLGLYGRDNSALAVALFQLHESGTLSWSIEAVAWTILAFSETSRWLTARTDPKISGTRPAC